ncbi:26750_t:CDS:2, partial [Gigaspora margarita]
VNKNILVANEKVEAEKGKSLTRFLGVYLSKKAQSTLIKNKAKLLVLIDKENDELETRKIVKKCNRKILTEHWSTKDNNTVPGYVEIEKSNSSLILEQNSEYTQLTDIHADPNTRISFPLYWGEYKVEKVTRPFLKKIFETWNGTNWRLIELILALEPEVNNSKLD